MNTNPKDIPVIIIIDKYVVPKCICGFDLGEQRNDGYVEIYENIYEDIAVDRWSSGIKHNYLKRCPNCGQLLDWKYRSEIEED